MYYKIKIYLNRSIHKISISCNEEFYNNLLDSLENPDIDFLNLNEVIVPKSSIKKIMVKSKELKTISQN